MIVDFELIDAQNYLEKFSDNFFHLCLTDPPYIISKKTGFMDVKKGNPAFCMQTDYGNWDKVPLSIHNKLLYNVTKLLYKKLISSGVLVIFYDYWKLGSLKKILEANNFKMFKILEWQKTNPVPVNSKNFYLSGVREVAIACVKGGTPKFKSEYHNGVFNFPIAQYKGYNKRIHPNEKPIKLLSEIIKIHTDEGENIIDPFAGSATTLIAGIDLHRNVYGCEKNDIYYKQANERIKYISEDRKGILSL
jgi:site-specific DNA-methyltransferase (adenine-specific)